MEEERGHSLARGTEKVERRKGKVGQIDEGVRLEKSCYRKACHSANQSSAKEPPDLPHRPEKEIWVD